MIGESTQALIFIRISIFLLRLITPGSFLYCALVLISPFLRQTVPILDRSLFVWASSSALVWALRIFTLNEVWFYFWSQAKTAKYQVSSDYDDALTPKQREQLFNRVIAAVDEPRRFLSGWFLGAKPEDIYRGNMVEWLLWAFFNRHTREEFSAEHPKEIVDEIDRYISTWEKAMNLTIAPGYNDKVKCIRLNADPVRTVHRPACVYLGVGVLYDFLGWSRYYSLGMRHYIPSKSSGHRITYPYIGLPSRPSNSVLTYWYKPAAQTVSRETETLPFIFIHGIGAGLKVYREMITQIAEENPRSSIYLLEFPAVTMKFTDKLPQKEEFVKAVADLLHSNGHEQALFVGHSLGTVVASWIMHLQPKLCKSVILIDPVCFLLHLPNVAYNFLHREPETANHWLYWYFVSNEPGIAWFLGRGFFWFENVLWLDEVPKSCDLTVYLSENDMIVDIPSVFRYLTNEPIPFNTTDKLQSGDKIVRQSKASPNVKTVLWSGPEMDHAVFLLMKAPTADIVNSVHSAIGQASSRTSKAW
ncbi:protein of unknown function [Taphrina deformans PYCC 5710]|uniref:AB hydrolase-1 domain-containing protein n=1 Tax=Taphrina deformans (strain PYCC 5710 / ATCC 11124 / CBS 356.35 / IMI 108563 / JCM 9778 / NBRC 8474) TaxID=1097556 RepID=R4XGI7_TAPDE|nr:protein of unknown function [Taphrina deformans PYCC 5710]|eukprot:CCG84762.1 protein of unknown function [Taphrina deformans PYCC 5710]